MEGKDLWKIGCPELICIKCDEGGKLLVCSENDCLLAVHEECIGFPARFDDAGNFYCPHCFLRQAVRESQAAWKNAMSKKEALAIFEKIGQENSLEENKRAEAKKLNQPEGGVNLIASTQSIQTGNGIHGEGTANISPCRESDISRQAKRHDKLNSSENTNPAQNDNSISDKLNRIVESHQEDAQRKDFNEVQDRSIPFRRKLDDVKMHEERIISSMEKEKVSQSSRGSTDEDRTLTAHMESNRRCKTSDSLDTDSEAISVRIKHTKSRYKNNKKQKSRRMNPPRRSSLALRAIKVFDVKVDTSRRLKQSVQSSANQVKHMVVSGKRKRLMWRKEEEEMLKEGVQKFSSTAKQNLPWRKILEFGRHVFDETRTPIDLKDKWRNLLGK